MAQAPADAIGVKLSTPRRGCSGLAYSVDYVTAEDKFDEKIETPGGTFYVDGGSILYLIGSVMDWREDDFTAGFVFENPNAKGSCGCGKASRSSSCQLHRARSSRVRAILVHRCFCRLDRTGPAQVE